MTSSKWIACCHRSISDSLKITNNSFHLHHSESPSSFNTFGGRRYKWSPSTSSNNSSSFIQFNQSPVNSSPASFSSISDWGNHSQSSVSSSSIASFNSTFQTKTTPRQLQSSKFHDLPCYTSNNHFKSKDDSMMRDLLSQSCSSQTVQNIITLINPFEYRLINCETNIDTNCAQISPEQEIIAVSNEYWLAFYSIRDNDCLGTIQFPNKCIHWTWINGDTVAIITEDDVFHWSLYRSKPYDNYPKLIFPLDEEIKNYQIVNYIADPLYGCWCALTALYLEDDGEIGGKIQIYSFSYMQSQCIEAHSCLFVSYRFEGNANNSNLLIAVKRENRDLWKLYIIELSAMPNGHFKNRPLKSQQLMLHGLQTLNNTKITAASDERQDMPFDDIPTHIACDNYVGLIFIVSKYGSIYICDLETGTPLYYDSINYCTDNGAIFSLSYDHKNSCLLAICRNGQVLVIKILLKKLLEQKTLNKLQSNIYMRISEKIQCRKLSRMITNPNSDCRNNNKNSWTVRIMVNNQKLKMDKTNFQMNVHHTLENSSEKDITEVDNQYHSASFYNDDDDDDLEEEITRL